MVKTETFAPEAFATSVADRVTAALPDRGAVIITGGTTAAEIYEHLDPARFDDLDVFFSDERCVPPDHDESNFRMATELFLGDSRSRVHRMEGELDPADAARRYHDDIQPFVAEHPALLLLGMGADCHVGALYPGSPALAAADYCAAVERPDGMDGVTLTPHAMLAARSLRVVVAGEGKADALRRVLHGDEEITDCPARLVLQHPDTMFWVDERAASLL